MITTPKLPLVSSSRQYAIINTAVLDASHAGTVLSLPLVYEFTRESSILSSYPNLFKVLTTDELKATLNMTRIYPIFCPSSQKIKYLSQLVLLDTFSISSNSTSQALIKAGLAPIHQIHYKSTRNQQYNIRSTDSVNFNAYTVDGKYYEPASVTTHSFETYLQTQLFTRYSTPLRVRDDDFKYTILDTYAPFLLVSNIIDNQLQSNINNNFPRYKAISPFTAQLLNVDQIPLTTIITNFLKKDLDSIKQTLLRIKSKSMTIVFAGVGGTGTNSIIWLSELLNILGLHNIFDEVHIYEKDLADFSNLFRFPVPLTRYTSIEDIKLPKTSLIKSYTTSLSSSVYFHEHFLESISDYPSLLLTPESKAKPNVVVYGAPSIANRNFLSSVGNFVSATHANNTASLYANPIADETLQVETYGLIQLNSFFINQISMLLGFLDMLDTDAYMAYDHHYADYSFVHESIGDYYFNIQDGLEAIPVNGD